MNQSLPATSAAPRCGLDVRRIARISAVSICLLLVFFGPTDNWSWDPSFYYAQIRSPIVEHDLDFRNETHTGAFELPYTETGLQESPWPVGPSVLWSPFFLLGHGLMRLIDPAHADGFDALSLVSTMLGSIGYGLVGLMLIYAIACRLADRFAALIATALCCAATPLEFYLVRQPIMAHTTGLFSAALMLWIYLDLADGEQPEWLSGLLFGVTLGLCFLTRWNGLLLAAVPGIYFLTYLRRAVISRSPALAWLVLAQSAILVVAFLITLTPQIALWYQLHHKIVMMPQGSDAFVASIWPLNLPRALFDTNRGILFWCPFVLLGVIGAGFIRDARLRLLGGLLPTFQLVLIGYRVDWYSGGGFGARYMIELLPFIVPGFLALLQRLPGRTLQRWVLLACGAILILHQLVLLYAVEHMAEGWIDPALYGKGLPLGLAWQWESVLRLLRDPALWLAPRPYVSVERQAFLVNLLAGVRDPQAYRFSLLAAALTPLLVTGLSLFAQLLHKRALARLLTAIALYFLGWAVFILLV
ncbi:MAG: glycosyltransferase family 39 protein [Oscillochloris sp.]|nr:glycosyltransferase family 39 protein [Oscillochloris sp.]